MDHGEPGSALAGKRILVVEDEALLAFELVAELEAAGAMPFESSPDIAHALQVVQSDTQLDAAVLNVWLRGLLSFPVAEALRRRDVPFIFVTGSAFDALQQYPDVTSHPKPADMEAVVRSLAKLIARREDGR